MRVAVFGCGYVGLVSGASLARLGHDVVCIDKDVARIAALTHGELPFFEPGLDVLLSDAIGHPRLAFATNADAASAVTAADIIVIAVGTPLHPGRAWIWRILLSERHRRFATRGAGSQRQPEDG